MSKDREEIKRATRQTAELYFKGLPDHDRPYELWKEADPDLAREMSIFFTGQLYARQVVPHTVRQLITVAVLTALGHAQELKLHIWAAFNVGCTRRQIAEAIWQTMTYAGVPLVNQGLKALQEVAEERSNQGLEAE